MSKNKILTCCIFVIAGLVVGTAFVTATTYFQLGVAILLYPLLVYFLYRAFPRKARRYLSKKPVTPMTQTPMRLAEETKGNKKENMIGIADIDKRAFLKLIGGVGLSLFLFSIFNKKAENLFFKSLPASGSVSLKDANGNSIDPAQNQPTDGYKISEIDDNTITFYGFTNKHGVWFIMKEDTDSGSFRYTRGDSNFPDNWTNRKNLKYDYFSNVFRP